MPPLEKNPASLRGQFLPSGIYLPVPVRFDVCGLLLALSWTIN